MRQIKSFLLKWQKGGPKQLRFVHTCDTQLISVSVCLLPQAAISADHNVSEDSVTVDDVVLKPGSKKGDGFSSDIAAVHFKASFDGQELDKNYIAKYAPEGNRGAMLKMVRLLTISQYYKYFLEEI